MVLEDRQGRMVLLGKVVSLVDLALLEAQDSEVSQAVRERLEPVVPQDPLEGKVYREKWVVLGHLDRKEHLE